MGNTLIRLGLEHTLYLHTLPLFGDIQIRFRPYSIRDCSWKSRILDLKFVCKHFKEIEFVALVRIYALW